MLHQRKLTLKTVSHGKVKSAPDNGSVDSPIQHRPWYKCSRIHTSEDIIKCWIVQKTSYSYASVNKTSSSNAEP